jgi:hypothetical protein
MTRSPHAPAPRILLVGAYERDNFGDLLYLLVTERYLAGADVVASAPFSADMTALLDREVLGYAPLLRSESFDAIWTVGGQVGAIDLRRAYRMSAPAHAYRRYRRRPRPWQERSLHRAAGGTSPLSPYIPSPLEFPRNAGAVRVVNSAGLSGIGGVEPVRRAKLLALLRGQTAIAVRDRPSSALLAAHGIEHRLEPDAVHALGALVPSRRDPRSDIAIVQVSSAILRRLDHGAVAAAIAASPRLRALRIRLLLAGTATGHDSMTDCELLASHVRRLAPRLDVEIIGARRPLALVDEIRRARVVVGSSLHVRIAASAYGVPRVSLRRSKPTRYARTWDPDMPYDVSLPALDAAVGAAMTAAEHPEVAARSAALVQRTHRHLTSLAADVLARAITPDPAHCPEAATG